MIVYGVALLAFCMLVGAFVGELIGRLIGIDANVGGVGISMLLLLFLAGRFKDTRFFGGPAQQGVTFWSAMYIPIVVAMAARQDVVSAVSGGWLAIVAGVGAVAVSFALVPVLSRLGGAR